jgi:hypothetical protein
MRCAWQRCVDGGGSGSEGDSDEMCVWRQRKNRASVGALSGDVTSVE